MIDSQAAIALALLTVVFAGPAFAQTPTFSRVETATPFEPSGGVSVGDFDGDGFPDLVLETRNQTDPVQLYFLHGIGNGTFATPVLVFAGCCPTAAAGDFNGDHALDLVWGGQVSVLTGNGDGTFGSVIRSATTVFTGRAPLVADFNRDGRLDVAFVNQGNGVAVALGNGDGTFGAAAVFPVGSGGEPGALAAGDVNGDGVVDIAASDSGTADAIGTNVSVLIGRGDGTFEPPVDYRVGPMPLPIALTDLNGDNQLDIAVANYLSGSVSVLLRLFDGTFYPQTDVPVGPYLVGLGAADFNGDGYPDVAVGGASPALSVLLGAGDGTLGSAIDFPALSSTQRLAVADFNRDGRPDVLVVYLPTHALSVFLNTTGSAADRTPPVITLAADPAILSPPNGRLTPVTLTGTIADAGSGVDATSATFQITDEYGEVQPSGAVTVQADSSYRVQVLLPASRRGSDADGRTFTVTVSASDVSGNRASEQALVRVPHDRGHAAGGR